MTLAVSAAIPVALSAQNAGAGVGSVGSGGATGAGSSSVGVVGPVGAGISGSAATTAGVAGSGAVSPSGTLSGRPTLGGTITSPAGDPVRAGTAYPGGVSGSAPRAVGRTFDRSATIIGGAPGASSIDPAGTQPTFRFPPSSTLPTPLITNTFSTGTVGFPQPAGFPPGPVGIPPRNIVGANMGTVLGADAAREPVTINLPPGARVVTNGVGVSEVVVPPPAVVGTDLGNVGSARRSEVGRGTSGTVPSRTTTGRILPREVPRATPPPAPPSRGPILDNLDR